MRILLIQPGSGQAKVGFSAAVQTEPLALEIIAASVPEHEVQILDMRIEPNLGETLSSFSPQLVGVTGYTPDVPTMLDICRQVKSYRQDAMTVVGGYHASLCPQDFDSPHVDVAVAGEGEVTFRELVEAIEGERDLGTVDGIIFGCDGRRVATPPRSLSPNLNSVPLPARHLIDHYRPHYYFHFWENPYTVETTRGCPYRCSFCAVWKFHRGKCRAKTPEAVLRDLKTIPSPIICCVDDNFLQDLRRAERLYELIKASGIQHQYWIQARADTIAKHPDIVKKWASIGLKTVLIGFEGFRDEELEKFNKRSSVSTNEKAMEILGDNGVDTWGAFIVDPQWARPEFDALIDYVRQMKIAFPFFTVLTPIPGTAFFREKLKELTTRNYELFDFLHSVLPTKLSLEEFYGNMARLYARTAFGLTELRRRIRSGQVPHSSLERVREILKEVTNPETYLKGARTGTDPRAQS